MTTQAIRHNKRVPFKACEIRVTHQDCQYKKPGVYYKTVSYIIIDEVMSSKGITIEKVQLKFKYFSTNVWQKSLL